VDGNGFPSGASRRRRDVVVDRGGIASGARTPLLEVVCSQFALDLDGIHGIRHWTRVLENGVRLAERTGADVELVTLFAWLHDSRRRDDGYDPGHGGRAADWITGLRGRWIHLDDERFELLARACRYHSDGLMEGDVTLRTCWDADRLDLGRVGIRPDPRYLCTEAARDPEILEWAWRRSL
jgi:uncharacterized protein